MEKQRWEESERRRKEVRKSERKKRWKKEEAGVQKGRKVAIQYVFPMICVTPGGRKVGSLKRRVRSHLARWEMKNCTPLWREAHVQVKMHKAPHVQTTFGSCNVEKLHAVAHPGSDHFWKSKKRTPLWREAHFQVKMHKAHNPGLDHFWKLRCRKSASRCGAKHISKSKV